MESVLFLRHHFLPLSETFIYKDLTGIKRFSLHLFCLKRLNQNLFPFSNFYQPNLLEKNYYRLFRRSKTLARIIKEKDIRLIHCQIGVEGVYGLPYKRRFSLPLVVSFHGFEFFVPFSRRYQNPTFFNYCRHYQELAKEGDLFLCVSKKTRADLINLGYPEEKVLTLYLGVELDKLPKKSDYEKEPLEILFLGRLTEKKGILLLIDAFSDIARKWGDVYLKIIGDGELRREVLTRIERYKLRTRVIWRGALPNQIALKEMAEADIFVLPSYKTRDGNQEGTPYTLFEAQGIGLPVISTDHSGIPEVVRDGDTGFLVKEKDREGLAARLGILIKEKKLRREMGEKGREFMKEFSLEKRIKKLEELYSQLL